MLPVAVVILIAACSSAAPSSPPTAEPTPSASAAGFATPEDAVRAYLAGVADADVDAVLATAAVDEAAENFDFEAQADRLQILLLLNPAPAQYPFYQDLNRSWFSQRLLGQTQTLSYSLLSTREIQGAPIPIDPGEASEFVGEVDPSRLAPLGVVDIKPPRASFEDDPDRRENALKTAAIFGADDDVQRVALVKLGDQHYEVGFELLQYDDGWKVLFQTASLASPPLDVSGAALPITPEEFDAQTSE